MRVLQVVLALAACVGTVLMTDCFLDPGGSGSRALPGSSMRKPVEEKPSANEVQDVVRAWATIKQSLSLRYLGVTILMTFLKLYPEYFKFFADTDKQPVETLPQNKHFVSKSVSFIYDLTSLLDNLDDLELVEITAKKVGRRRQIEGATETSFDDIRNLILHLVSRYHKQYALRFPLGIVESTTRTLNWIITMIKKGLLPEGKENHDKVKQDKEKKTR